MSDIDIVTHAILSCSELPFEVHDSVRTVRNIDRSTFDVTYIDFLDEQIGLEPRGAEWTELLRIRRERLSRYVDVPLLNAKMRVNEIEYSFKISPNSQRVVYWEIQS